LPVTWSKEPSSQIKRKETKRGMAEEPSQPVKKKKFMGSLSFGQTRKNKSGIGQPKNFLNLWAA